MRFQFIEFRITKIQTFSYCLICAIYLQACILNQILELNRLNAENQISFYFPEFFLEMIELCILEPPKVFSNRVQTIYNPLLVRVLGTRLELSLNFDLLILNLYHSMLLLD